MKPVAPVTLADDVVRLEPLTAAHAEAVWNAASGARDTYALTRVPGSLDDARAYVVTALADQEHGVSVPFATCDAKSGAVVGSTRFMTIERWKWPGPHAALSRGDAFADVVEIGSTWLSPAAQRTAINTHAKLLMLTHAFEVWEVRRVMLKTDARNARSRGGIERIGARFDGILRAHMPGFDGQVRDTAYYSILASEWPSVKGALQEKARR